MKSMIRTLLDRMNERRRRIVFVGDTVLDKWVIGEEQPCQDGCTKFVQTRVVQVPGGAGNADRSLRQWEVNKSLYGYDLDDCPIKLRCVDYDNNILFRLDDEAVPRKTYRWAHEQALEMVEKAGGVLISDYDKGFLTKPFISAIIKICEQNNIPCVADCKREPSVYEGAILKGNHEYFSKYAEKARTRGSRAVTTIGPHYPILWYEGVVDGGKDLPPVKCVNHVGAGDCFGAHLILALAYKFSLKDAVALAYSAGRVYVQHPFNRPPTPSEIAADMAHREVISTSTP